MSDMPADDMNDNGPRTRIQLDFSPRAIAKLDAMRERSNVKSNPELFRRALPLLAWYLEQVESGAKIQVVKDGVVKEVEFRF